jgi:predicted ferric reductase
MQRTPLVYQLCELMVCVSCLNIKGPFGAPAEDLYDYKVACLIGAGIGVTPAAALLKSIWYRQHRNSPMPLEKVYFIWVNRDKDAFEWFQSLLSTIEDSVPSSFLEIHVYMTVRYFSNKVIFRANFASMIYKISC